MRKKVVMYVVNGSVKVGDRYDITASYFLGVFDTRPEAVACAAQFKALHRKVDLRAHNTVRVDPVLLNAGVSLRT